MWDVLVAGAGPAGAAAAQVLARNGHRVLLADPGAPRAKIGEALCPAAAAVLRALALPLPSEGPHAPIGGNLSAWGDDELRGADFLADAAGPGWRLDRARFDRDLCAAAVGSGAAFRAASVENVTRSGGAWQVRLAGAGTVHVRWLVDATGRRAALARRLGARRLRDARLVAIYAIGESAMPTRLGRTLIEATHEGWWYGGRLPSGRPIAGFHTAPGLARKFLALDTWRQALSRTRHLGPLMAGACFTSPLPALEACGARLDTFAGEDWIACGDAALSFDPISGQGLLSALQSGASAGRTVAEALGGSGRGVTAHAASLSRVRQTYLAGRRSVYAAEARWPGHPFWRAMGEVGTQTAFAPSAAAR